MVDLPAPETDPFETPPPGFDPSTATRQEATRFGLLPLPEQDSPAEYKQFWATCVTRDLTFVDLPCSHDPYSAASDFTIEAIRPAPAPRIRFDNWAGVGFDSTRTPLVAAWCICRMPSLSMPESMPADGACLNSVWVGLDGLRYPATDILQIGVDFLVERRSGVVTPKFYPWCEWFGSGNCYLKLPVDVGHTIALAVYCELGAKIGSVYLINLTTKQMYRRKIHAPTDRKLLGDSVEWVVERQTLDGVMTNLCQFGSVVIEQACASTMFPPRGGGLVYASSGTAIDMVNTFHPAPGEQTIVIAKTTVLGPDKIEINRVNANAAAS